MRPETRRHDAISIHALLAESDAPRSRDNSMGRHISIHALLAESDTHPIGVLVRVVISIHALLAESDDKSNKPARKKLVFLSTLSLRRATTKKKNNPTNQTFLSTLSLRRATLSLVMRMVLILLFLSTLSLRRATVTVLGIQHKVGISIHALLAESDGCQRPCGRPTRDFYPRSPCGERQQKCTKQWGTFCAYETNFMGIASSC